MSKSKGPLLTLFAILAVAVGLVARELIVHQITVTAADGSEVVIETDHKRLAERAAAGDADTMRKYGVSPHAQEQELPQGTGREANLSGTKVR